MKEIKGISNLKQFKNYDVKFSYNATNYEKGVVFERVIYRLIKKGNQSIKDDYDDIFINRFVVKHEQLIEIFGEDGAKMSVGEMFNALYDHTEKVAFATIIQINQRFIYGGSLPATIRINDNLYDDEYDRKVNVETICKQITGEEKCTSKTIAKKLKRIFHLEENLVGKKVNTSSLAVN